MTTSIFDQIEAMKRSAEILIQAAAEHDAENEEIEDDEAEILAAEWDESKYTRDKSGRFGKGGSSAVKDGKDGGPAPIVKRTSSAMTEKSAGGALVKKGTGGGGLVKQGGGSGSGDGDGGAKTPERSRNPRGPEANPTKDFLKSQIGPVALGVGLGLAYRNRESIQAGLNDLGDKVSGKKISNVAAAIDGVKSMGTKVKSAMAGLDKKLGISSAKDAAKSGGEHFMESVAKMGSSMKSGSQKAMQLTAARAATAVAAAQNEAIRNEFVKQLKQAKSGEEVIKTIHGAAAAIDTGAHFKVGTDNAKKAIGEHAADIGKGTAAAVAIGAAVMASKKFMKGKGAPAAKGQGLLPGSTAPKALPGKTAPKALPGKTAPKALPPGVKGGPMTKAGETGMKPYGAIVKSGETGTKPYGAIVKSGSNAKPKKGINKAAAAAAAVAVGVAGLGAAVAANKENK